MDFSGPEPADYANVHALNAAFLAVLRDGDRGTSLRRQLPEAARSALQALSTLQVQRLGEVPFLLMSFREYDEDHLRRIVVIDRQTDLLRDPGPLDDARRLATAGIGFLWHLARRNPYATRLVSGASIGWCERLADSTLLPLVQNIACSEDLPEVRFADDPAIWSKLLGPGVSAETAVRSAAQLTVLHALLTLGRARRHDRLRSAACATASPVLHIAQRSRRP